MLKNQLGKSPFPDQTVSGNKLHITYESVTNSSFSDVIMRVMSFSRARCYDVYSFQDPIIQDMPLTDFDQLDCGFNVVDISKGEKVFLQRGDDPTSEEGFKVVFPHADVQSSSLIVHPPSEVWGCDDKQLILGVEMHGTCGIVMESRSKQVTNIAVCQLLYQVIIISRCTAGNKRLRRSQFWFAIK